MTQLTQRGLRVRSTHSWVSSNLALPNSVSTNLFASQFLYLKENEGLLVNDCIWTAQKKPWSDSHCWSVRVNTTVEDSSWRWVEGSWEQPQEGM